MGVRLGPGADVKASTHLDREENARPAPAQENVRDSINGGCPLLHGVPDG